MENGFNGMPHSLVPTDSNETVIYLLVCVSMIHIRIHKYQVVPRVYSQDIKTLF